MGIEFTREQQQVIDLRDCNLLVSAAAGSGKTAVLVGRIIERLTKDQPPLNVDELLVVTYTDAAAAEMKERIHAAIEKALEEQSDNEHLQRQTALIHQANISTMHTFCMSVIRENFHLIGLDSGVRVGESGEIELLKQDVLKQVLEEAYQKATPEFLFFVECYAPKKSDYQLEDLILNLHKASESHPNPTRWLDECVKQYELSNEKELNEKEFAKTLVADLQKEFVDWKMRMEFCIEICESEEGPLSYKENLLSDILQLERFAEADSFTKMQAELQNYKWQTLTPKKKADIVSEEKQKQVRGLRDDMKERVKEIKEDYFKDSFEEIKASMNAAGKNVAVLVELVKRFSEEFTDEKRKKNVIDFNDMEHFALKILTKELDGKFVPSEVAEGYQEKFAEIMIDEYQDINLLQEEIMKSISGVSNGKHNLFMVGDVKQSIYRFRLARPELFLKKYQEYDLETGKERRVDLSKNFRSRREVLDSTNFVFEQIMTVGLGGIAYDDKAALYVGANYEEQPNNETELLLLDLPGYKAEQRMELEGDVIAKRIKELKENHQVLDKKTGTYRKVRYSDIVILTRSPKHWNKPLAKALNQAGIPTYMNSKEGYFQTYEIQLVLNYLRILDNPRQDIPLTSVLTSTFGNFAAEELALIQSHTKGNTMYENILGYLENGEDAKIKQHLQMFMELFERFRNMVPYTAIHVLLWRLMEESGYLDYMAAFPNGEQRIANLEMLIEKAVAFEGTSYKGLFNFVRYMEQIEKYEIDFGEANLMDDQMDVVTLMSMHKSKGLEFPVVFVAGLGKQISRKDIEKNILYHSDWGIGMEQIDPIMRTKRTTLLKEAIAQKLHAELDAEELRVLYVAMTRAKEKMIITGGVSNLEKRLQNFEILKNHCETTLPYRNLSKANDAMEWLLAALYRNQCFTPVREDYSITAPFQNPLFFCEIPMKVKRISIEEIMKQEIEEVYKEGITREILKQWGTEETYDADIREQLEQQFTYSYPYQQEQKIKQKLSVSELKKQIYEDEEGEDAYREEDVIPLLPKFIQEDETLTGAFRGTAYHKLMESLDFTKEYDETLLRMEMLQMQEKGILTEKMSSCIQVKDILKFLQSDIGKRMKLASQKGNCFAEQPFVMGMPARIVYPDSESDEIVLVQGIIDAYFEEEGQLVVVDYKTDRVFSAAELKNKYLSQLEYYAEALERLTGKVVKEKRIYSFALHKEIAL